MLTADASSAPARSATSTRSTTSGCCSSPRTGSAPSTSSCRPPIPDKGRVLTGLSRFWFDETARHRPEPPAGTDAGDRSRRLGAAGRSGELRGRMMVCRRRARCCRSRSSSAATSPARAGRNTGATASVCGIALPAGLRESDRLPEPILTPATKAEAGQHDENIDFERWSELADWAPVGDDALGASRARPRRAGRATSRSRLYGPGARDAPQAGILLADTKFEMGLVDGELILVDEVLTPDSSRFWDAATYEPGGPQASFDKQFVRDWLERQPWDKTAPGPGAARPTSSPGTRARYVEAFERITGASFERYLAEDVDRADERVPVRGQRPAEARDPRSAGPRGRGQPRPPRDRGRLGGPGRAAGRADGRGADEAAARAIGRAPRRRAVLEPADRVLRDRWVDIHAGSQDDPHRRRRLPRLELRPRHAARRSSSPAPRPCRCGTSRARSTASPRSCCPAASPTATTCAPA